MPARRHRVRTQGRAAARGLVRESLLASKRSSCLRERKKRPAYNDLGALIKTKSHAKSDPYPPCKHSMRSLGELGQAVDSVVDDESLCVVKNAIENSNSKLGNFPQKNVPALFNRAQTTFSFFLLYNFSFFLTRPRRKNVTLVAGNCTDPLRGESLKVNGYSFVFFR